MSWYRTGSADFTSGSQTVTGHGTVWVANVQAGHGIIGPNGAICEIASVNSDTSLTLFESYSGSTANEGAYKIIPTQGLTRSLAESAAQLVTDFGAVAAGAGAGRFSAGTVSAPGISYAVDPDSGVALTGSNNLALVTGGAAAIAIDSAQKVSIPNADITVANNTAVYLRDAAGTARRAIQQGSDGTFYFGDIDNAVSGSNTAIRGGSNGVSLYVGGQGPALVVNGARTVDMARGLTLSGPVPAVAALGSGVFSYESPITRAYIGDGSGYSFRFSKRAASTTTDVMTVSDNGKVGLNTIAPVKFLHVVDTSPGVGATQVMLESYYGGYGAGIIFASRTSSGGSITEMGRITADGTAPWDTDILNQNSALSLYAAYHGGLYRICKVDFYDGLRVENTNAAVGATQLKLESSYGGYGAGVAFQSRTSSGGTIGDMGKITCDGESTWGTSSTTQDAGMRFSVSYHGALFEAMRLTSSGHVWMSAGSGVPALAANETMAFRLESNSSLRVYAKGSDGTVRSGTIALT